MPNRLAHETSPYLLQHASNPVDWYPWGSEALARAKAEDRPIFLSIGYSACHWCHVMEHESFEDPEIAKLLNERFVCIKVDREERPDLDQIYMNAVQIMTGRGGWPMSVFLTPDLAPFYGGTYWPPHAGRGMPGFDQIILAVADAWQNRRAQAVEQAGELTKHLQQVESDAADGVSEGLRLELLQLAAGKLERAFDFRNGGFGSAPKFPHAMDLQVLLRVWRRWPQEVLLDMVKLNLDKMARGGIYDHLAGGFARYSVDERWLVPHFEKMLYDNALLSGAYLDGYLVTKNEEYARVARETFDYILAYMTDDRGGFHSTEDADSEGEEGKFYVWTPAEIEAVLGAERAARFCYVYDVSDGGNFEHGKSILNLPKTIAQCAQLRGWNLEELQAELADSRAKLLAVRDRRVRPGKDDKILVSWNALMIDSLARGAGILGEPKYLATATRAAEFIFDQMRRPDGRLLHTWRNGQAKLDAYLDDYAYLTNALVSLYEAGFDERWVDEAVRLANLMLARFADKAKGGFFFTADDHEKLISRQKDLHDSSVPSGNSMAATALLRLGALCGRTDYTVAAHETLASAALLMERAPAAAGQMLLAADMFFGPLPEIVILGGPSSPDTAEVLADLRRRFIPSKVVTCRATEASQPEPDASPRESLLTTGQVAIGGSPELEPIYVGKVARDALPAVFICQDFTCHTPASGKAAVLNLWARLAGGHGNTDLR
jgi:uncharacterized protein YyaL (SSP411 family)